MIMCPENGGMMMWIRGNNLKVSTMKIYKILFAAAVALSIVSCSKESVQESVQFERRTISVNCPITKTTIDYEGSDVSHLVWNGGETVGYITSCAGDRVQSASVNSNSFSAQIPSFAAEDDLIYVIYPLGDNEGKLLSEVSLPLVNQAVQNVSASFDGSVYPMFATAPLPSGSGNALSVAFEFPAAILRFNIFGEASEAEPVSVKSLSFSGKPYMTGHYSIGGDGRLQFVPDAEQGQQTIVLEADEDGDLVIDGEGMYVYAIVPRAEISDFDVKVSIDASSFSLTGGKMDLTRKDRSLWRISLDLNAVEEDEPEVTEPTVFKVVTSLDELNEDDKYLIVADKDAGSYYLAAPENYPYQPGGGTMGINAKAVAHDGDGNMEKTDELVSYAVTLKKGIEEENTFAICFDPSKGSNCWCCAPGGATNPVNNGFFFNPAPDTDSEEQGYWKFSYESPNVVVTSRKVKNQHFYFVQNYTSFRPAREDAPEYDFSIKGIKFLRLQ